MRTALKILLALIPLGVVCAFANGLVVAGLLTQLRLAGIQSAPTAHITALAQSRTPTVPVRMAIPVLTPTAMTRMAIPVPTRTPVKRVIPSVTYRRPATAIPTRTRTPTSTPTPTPTLAVRDLASMELDPRLGLVGRTQIFTSACFGANVNPLQDRDRLTPYDWGVSAAGQCTYGYAVNPADDMPTGRYTVSSGSDDLPHFNIIPREALASNPGSLKQLSQVQLIVDPNQGREALGDIGVTADGINYQCSACTFLKPGGICPSGDGSRSLALPLNAKNILDPTTNGGAFGFVGFPAVIFRQGFSLYFTGRDGYPPPRIYFENWVDTLRPGIDVKTTAEMSANEIKQLASEFDRSLSGTDPILLLAGWEQEAALLAPSPVMVRPREQAVFPFSAPPGAVLSSIVWRIKPLNNTTQSQFLETNLCLEMNGEAYCFTGVEDFAHCAFFAPCRTGYAGLIPTQRGEYLATRYFPAGSAPRLDDGKLTLQARAPDIGTILEMQVNVRFRIVR